jgi:hypothetical protein
MNLLGEIHPRHPSDPLDVTDFRFRSANNHNRDMLEYQAEKAFKAGAFSQAAAFAQAAGLYAIASLLAEQQVVE